MRHTEWAIIALATFLVGGIIGGFAFFQGAHHPETPRCVEESLSTIEAWRMVASPVYGVPPRFIVRGVASPGSRGLYACGEHESRLRCYELTDCKR